MPIWINTYHSKRNPTGGWEYRQSFEEWIGEQTALKQSVREDQLADLEQRCFCCNRDYAFGLTNGICIRCSEHSRCCICNRAFRPGAETMGRFCSECWIPILEEFLEWEHSGTAVSKVVSDCLSRGFSSQPRCTLR